MKVLADGGRQDLEGPPGPQDYEARTLVSGCAPRPVALPLFGEIEQRSRQSNEGKEFCTTVCFTYTLGSMTTLLTHTVAHSTKSSFRPKTNNQPLKKFLSLALS
jgi:hypothetical protein